MIGGLVCGRMHDGPGNDPQVSFLAPGSLYRLILQTVAPDHDPEQTQ